MTQYPPRGISALGYLLALSLTLPIMGCRSRHQSVEHHQNLAHISSTHDTRIALDSSALLTHLDKGQSSVFAIEEVEIWQADSLYGSLGEESQQVGPMLTSHSPQPLASPITLTPIQRWRRVYHLRESHQEASSHSEARQTTQALAEQLRQTALASQAHERTTRRSSGPLTPRLWWLILAIWCSIACWSLRPRMCAMLCRLANALRCRLSSLKLRP